MQSEVPIAGAGRDRGRTVENLERELAEARDQQAATNAILAAIATSPSDVQPVFECIVANSKRLLSAHSAVVVRVIGNELRLAAFTPTTPDADDELQTFYPRSLDATSPSAIAARDRTPFVVSDTERDDRFSSSSRELARARGYRSRLIVPMLQRGETIGLISVTRAEAAPFPAKDIALLQTFADQAVIAIENTRLFEAEQASKRELQESLEYQTATSDVLGVISRSPTELRPMLDTIARTSQRLCNADRSSVWRLVGGAFELAANSDYSPAIAQYMTRVPVPADRTSVAGRCVLEKRTLHVHDRLNEPGLPPLPQSYATGARTLLCVPLLREGEPIGVVRLSRDTVAPFTKRQIELVETFADQAVIAIENTRLFEAEQASKRELQESLEYQTATSEVLGVISRSPDRLQPVFDAIVTTGARLCEAEFSIFFTIASGKFRVAASNNVNAEYIKYLIDNPPLVAAGSVPGLAATEGRTVHIEDVLNWSDHNRKDAQRIGNQRTNLSVPLMRDGQPVGVLALVRTKVRRFSDRQVNLVETFADQAVIAIENTRLFEEVQARTKELSESLEQQTATSEILASHQQFAQRHAASIRRHCAERVETLSGRPHQRSAQVWGRDQRRGRRRAGSGSRRSLATHNFPYPPRSGLHARRSVA